MQEINVLKNDSGQRLDKFLKKKYKSLPFSMMYKLIRKKKITVNRKRCKENQILNENDLILIFAPDDLFVTASPKPVKAVGSVKIVYEDENILIADKESGLLVHSDESDDEDTLIDRIKAYLINKGDYNPDSENSFAPALCNRIDRNTEGLVIAAKNAQSLREMNDIIKKRCIEKKYLAVVHGVPKPLKGEIRLLLEKDAADNLVKVRNYANNNTKTAVTLYNTIRQTDNKLFSLVEIELVTGRTHQIRASFAHIGNPLLGDGKYAVNKKDREMGFKSQALCAHSIKFKSCNDYPLLGYLDGKMFYSKEPEFLKLFK